ncbi:MULTISPECIES: autotransporter domain-containing protein [unclassified Fusobacterium]|uniref:autotransporter domain-containing protein n=2 Tax=Fusobacterium TaxID=848 RepID=UPI001B8D2B29|nr:MULTISPECIES: autotransporter outer membrane beta-barrel domain-containing protein [unclassified Fusobacterium]
MEQIFSSNSSDIKVNTDLKLSEGSRGMTAAEGKKIIYDGQMELGEGATGISGVKNPVELAANANLKLQGKNSIGIYSEGNAKTDMHGTITLNKDKTIGIYAKDNTSIELDDGSKVEFGNDGTESIAIYLAGSKLTATTNDPDNPTTLKFEENPDSKNIFIHMQGINGADGPQGSSLALNRVLEVTPTGTPTGSQRTIGVYMDTEMANNGGFVGNTLSGRAKATNKGIAVYSKNHADSDDVYNTYEKVSITAEGEDTAGIFLDGNILVKGGSLLNVKDKAVGIYGNQGVISIDGTNKITVDNNGTGIYMSNGSHLDGGKLVLENKSPTEKAVGLYYNKGTGTEKINHNTELSIPKGNLMLGMYVDGGIKVNNMSKVDIADGVGNTVAYIVGGSEFTNKSDDITISGTNMKNAIGIYVGHGKGTNVGTIKITDKIGSATDKSLSVAMAAVNDGSGDSAVINSGNIEVGGETIGIYVDNNSSGENSGKIVAKNEAGTSSKPVAVYVNGQNAEFKNTGEINSDNIVIALEDTEKDIEFGKMKITGTRGVGVYAKNSKVNSDVMPEVDTNAHKTIALYAAGNTEINGTVSSAEGTGNIGAYLNDANVTFGNDAKIIAKNGTGTDYGIGIFAANGYFGDLKVDVEQQGAETMGMFIESGTPGNETKVKYTGTFDIGEGIGVFVPEHTEFIGDTATVKIDGGAGVFVSGGKMSMGTEGMINFEFGSKGGSAIYQDGGEVTVGENIGVKGYGTFLTLKDADADVHSVIPVMAQGTGINAMYEVKPGVTPADHTIKLSPTGGIRLLGDNATGISVAVKGLEGNNKKVTIINDGKIETESGKRTVGILAKGASVTNSGELNIGSEGIGIFATTDATDTGIKVVNKDIKLSGEDAIGILVDKAKTNEVVEAGKIEASGDEHIGIYVKDTHGLGKITVQNYVFESDSNGTGAIFDNAEAKLTASSGDRNSIKIGDTVGKSRGIAIAGINGTGEVDSTDVEIGKNSIGIYSGKSNIKFDGGEIKSTTGESVLVYSDEGEITLSNVTNGLTVGTGGIAVAASEGKVVTGSPMSIKVDGENGIGVFVEGDATNPGEVSSNFKIDVDGGIGIYAKGNVISYGTLNSLKGDNSKGYIFEDLANAANISHVVKLGENGETGQIGVYAKGTGTGVTINGIDIEGEGNIGVYNTANQSITENGDIILADNSGNNASVGIYSEVADTTDQRTVTVTGKIDVGVNNAGVYAKNSGVKQNSGADINVKSNGVGVLAENTADYHGKGNVEIGGNLIVGDDNAVGVQGINADIKISGDLSVGNGSSKGIYATEKGDIEIVRNMSVGNNSTGIFKDGEGTVTTQSGTITVGDNSQGILTKNSQVVNNSDIVIGKGSTGIAATKNITSVGDITVGDTGIGLLVKGDGTTKITTDGAHNIGDNVAIGIYADNTEVEVKSGSTMTIGDKDSVGIFSLGKGKVVIGGTTGDIAVGKDSIGIYKSGTGKIAVNNSHMDIDDKGYGIYFVGQSGENSIENTNLNMTLGTESVGIYAKNAKVTHNGDIKVGTTTIGRDGYNDPKANRNSIGIFGENSTIEYKGNMTVDKELSVGIYGAAEIGKQSSITLKKGSNLIVRNGAIGIMGGQGMKEIVVEKGALIDVAGKTSGGEKSSIGIAAYSGVIKNYGVIKLRDGGIAFNIGGSGRLGHEGEIDNPYGEVIEKREENPSTGDIGGVEINADGKVTINDKVINGGIIDVKGHLAMEGMALDIGNKKPIVKADSITGVAKVLPNFSKGNSVQKYTVADVFRTSPEGMGAFSGDVTSASVSWIAKVSKELGSTATRDITVARIPYPELIVGEKYENLAYGLEELRMDIPSTESSPQFKSMDNIHTHEQFAEAVADIRGDIYSNVQERMQTVENNFERSYRELLDSFNVTRNVHKFSLINTNGRHKDNTLGVSGYKYDSVGVLYLRDNERYSYGGKFGWSAGLMGTRFKFTDETNEGSKEKVVSGKLGLHYQRALVERDENARLKYLGRAELTLNRHRAKRYSRIGQDSYKARATYYSADISLRNRILYDYDMNTQWTVRPYLGLDLSYGRFSNIKERDNEFDLKVKHNDYYLVTPNAGVETKYRIPVAEDKEVVVKADVQVDYDAHKLYTDANKAKLKRTSTGYYKLSEPERDRVRTGVGAEIGIEKPDNYGVALRVEYNDANKSHMTYGVRFNYKF